MNIYTFSDLSYVPTNVYLFYLIPELHRLNHLRILQSDGKFWTGPKVGTDTKGKGVYIRCALICHYFFKLQFGILLPCKHSLTLKQQMAPQQFSKLQLQEKKENYDIDIYIIMGNKAFKVLTTTHCTVLSSMRITFKLLNFDSINSIVKPRPFGVFPALQCTSIHCDGNFNLSTNHNKPRQ